MKYPKYIKFDLKGIYISIVLILLASSAFIYYGNKFDKIGHLYVLLFLYALLAIYMVFVFIRTWWAAITFHQDYILDNHQIVGWSRKIRREKLISFELEEKYTKRGKSRFIEIKQEGVKRPHYILDDRIDCTIDELHEMMKEWAN